MKNADIELYRQLLRTGATHSLRDFSSYYLGMAENAACLSLKRGGFSARGRINLFRRLWEERRYLLALKVARLILWEGSAR